MTHYWRCRRVKAGVKCDQLNPRTWWVRKVRFARQVERIGWLSFYNLDGTFSNHVRWVRVGRKGPAVWWCTDMTAYQSWPHQVIFGAAIGDAYVALLRGRR